MDVFTLLDEVRAIARTGLKYAENPFDRDRYEKLLELVTAEYAERLAIEAGPLRDRFVADLGHATAKVGADAAVFDDDGRILLVHRTDDGLWGLPAGWVDPGEHPATTVVRELKEEVGVDGVVDQLVDVFGWPASADHPNGIVAILYLCTLSSFDFVVQPHEVVECAFREIDEVEGWHGFHETYARRARKAWRAKRDR